MSWWWPVVAVIGVNFVVWGSVGVLRVLDEALHGRMPRHRAGLDAELSTADVAVLMAAHNEELVLGTTLADLVQRVPPSNVHVVSDGSSDDTVQIAQAAGVQVIETPTNVGKAGALKHGLDTFDLAGFEAVLFLDADSQLDEHYFDAALPLLRDPRVVAVAGRAATRWERKLGPLESVVVAHRERIYVLTQLLVKFGQTWRGINATHIVPGFASIYRARVLPQIHIDAPGLVIEDFNMTFEVHAKHLGRIAFSPGAKAYTQDPSNYRDYVGQTRRWALGLWQTVRRNQPRRPVFIAALATSLLELLVSALVFLALPVVVLLLALAALQPALLDWPAVGAVLTWLTARFSLLGVLVFVVLPDYLLTCVVAAVTRKPRFLLAGLAFLPMRVTDSWVALSTLPRAWSTSSGRWTSPTRRAVQTVPGASEEAPAGGP